MIPHWAVTGLAWTGAWFLASLLGGAAWAALRHRKHPARAASPRPAPASPGAGDSAPRSAAASPGRPDPGTGLHHRDTCRGDHMVIDIWQGGCIYTWTRATGWIHDTDCIDEQIRRLLTS